MPSRNSSPASVRSYASVASEGSHRSQSPVERSGAQPPSPGSKSSDTAVSGPIQLVEKYLPGGRTVNVEVRGTLSEAGDDVISVSSEFSDDGAHLDPDDSGYRGKAVNTRVVGTETQSIIQTRAAKRKSVNDSSSKVVVSLAGSSAGGRDAASLPAKPKGRSTSSKGVSSSATRSRVGTDRSPIQAQDEDQAVSSKTADRATRSVDPLPIHSPPADSSTSKSEKKSKRTRSNVSAAEVAQSASPKKPRNSNASASASRSRSDVGTKDERERVAESQSNNASTGKRDKSKRSRRDDESARARARPASSSTGADHIAPNKDEIQFNEDDGLSEYERARKKTSGSRRRSQRMVVTPDPSSDGSDEVELRGEDSDVPMDQYDVEDPFIDDSAVGNVPQDHSRESEALSRPSTLTRPEPRLPKENANKATVRFVPSTYFTFVLTSLAPSTPPKRRSSNKGKGVDRPGRSSPSRSSLPFMASAPVTGPLPVTPTPSSKTAPPRRTFGDVLGKNKAGQTQDSSDQGRLGGKDVLTLDDVTCLPVRDIPTKSEVVYPELQDPLLAMFYVDLPPLR
ncbi:hypothetical protein EST38_g12056 [Candolleomyces aberdarensis]|uniref:Uncharacterized protein n=1 Tax=Candolleomyces aberdarensis TaxID=2316362 RepID=A0A4V1Q244_9AGAR|nr:hypothetical protein EST38_g12056 [Candolleomyces aberdarensis]